MLERNLCQFLTSCILNRDAVGSVVKEHYHEIILEIFQIALQMLFFVIPILTHELLTDQVDVRIKALNLIRKLIALSGQKIAQEYPHVFTELLNRFSEKSAEVRVNALLRAKAFCTGHQSGRESHVFLDNDDEVRSEAVNIVCELVKSNLSPTSPDLISLAAEKLRDKKLRQLIKDKKEDDLQEIGQIMSKILMHRETRLLKCEALVTPSWKTNIERIKILFKKFDFDGSKLISKSQLPQLLSTVKFGDFKPKNEDALKELHKDFDKDVNSI